MWLERIRYGFFCIGGFLGGIFGGLDELLYALCLCVAIDYITGLMVAFKTKELSSQIGFVGLFRKVVIFFLVGLASVIDTRLLCFGSAIRTATIFFYISNEGISILENAAKLGVAVPEGIRAALKQLRESDENDN